MQELKLKRVYRHFKGDYYLVEDVARSSESGEEYVVYRKLYGDGGLWIRPKEMFLSEVDREKYPDAGQKYRFELQEIESGRALKKRARKEALGKQHSKEDIKAYNRQAAHRVHRVRRGVRILRDVDRPGEGERRHHGLPPGRHGHAPGPDGDGGEIRHLRRREGDACQHDVCARRRAGGFTCCRTARQSRTASRATGAISCLRWKTAAR